MATVINNPPSGGNTGNTGGGLGMILGIILVIIVLMLFFVFGWPILSRTGGGDQAPSGGNPNNNGSTYNVPDRIDINVQKE